MAASNSHDETGPYTEILTVPAAIYAEALALATKVGISPQRFDSVIRGGRMDCGF
jgi:3-hydroxyisobutyrate dehydrogenase-like beta-hydroxyacid dehydrogenase